MRITNGLYPENIARCQHIRTNGIQCNCPALKNGRYCYFHSQWHKRRNEKSANDARRAHFALDLPVLEDANSVQVALMKVMQLFLNNQIDAQKAGIMMYGLQTAAINLRRTTFQPSPTMVVIDPADVPDTCLGDHAWYSEEFTQPERKKTESAADRKKKAEHDAKMEAKARALQKENDERRVAFRKAKAAQEEAEKSLALQQSNASPPPSKPPARVNGNDDLPARKPAPN